MLLRLSRASFWFAASAAALGLWLPGGRETLLTWVALVASAAAFVFWRHGVRERTRANALARLLPTPSALADTSLCDAAAGIQRCVAAAPSFEAALHGVARLLKSELGAREVTVHEVLEAEPTRVRVARWVESRPGLRLDERWIRVEVSALAQSIAQQCERGEPPGVVGVPVVRGGRVVAALELTGIDIAFEPEALAGLLVLSRRRLGERASSPGTGGVNGVAAARDDAGAAAATQSDPAPAHRPKPPEEVECCVRRRFNDTVSGPLRQNQPLAMLNFHSRPPASPASPASPGASGGSAAAPATPGPGAARAPLPGLDAVALARLTALDPTGESKLLERVLNAFRSSAARLMPQLDAAHRAGDRDAIRLVAHTLKSSSASIGALALSQLCAQVEASIRLDATAALDAEIGAMSEALDLALKAIERLLTERSP